MKHALTLLLAVFAISLSIETVAQTYDPLQPPNSYRSADNPNYWKNKMPHAGYWQQDVHYTIKANVDEKTDIIAGNETLVYWNNSPNELNHVFFHLYQEAFQPGSYNDAMQQANGRKPHYGKYESEGKGTEILSLKVNGQTAKTTQDNTILKVELPTVLRPGESITFEIQFETYFDRGGVRRRMKMFDAWGQKHYNGVHWYPRISVYDRKFGWTTDQHLGHEFYGDFGTFDVELTFANNFIVDGTGNLLNRNEMLPPELRKKLDIANFKDKEWNSPPSEIIAYDPAVRKTWKFHAENVHDFAWTADPTYRIGEAEWNGKKCIALAQEPHAARWQNAAEYTTKIIKTFSEDFGMYTYHKMIVADARDGMEYPMITLDGGGEPGYRGLFVHEVGHNWFFGQVGNNETYRAALDEGFTQFLTAWGLERIDGDTIVSNPPKNWYKKRFKEKQTARYSRAYYSYIKDAMRGQDPPLNTHSDAFHGEYARGRGYGHVYFKTATMLYNLQYVLGDELFLNAMQHYFATWKIAHPYVHDFRTSIIDYTKVDLNWFFDQWLETTKTIDYSIKSLQRGEGADEYIITFERKGEMQMPIDFRVEGKDGKQYDYHIPNTWFVKETNATVLNKWTGWDQLHPTYQASVTIPGGIKMVQIDPSDRLADVNMLNNTNKIRVNHQFDHRIRNLSDWRYYNVNTRPELWYNGYDGFKAGIHINGDYMQYRHRFDFTMWFNTGLAQWNRDAPGSQDFDQLSLRLNYRTPLDLVMRGAEVWLQGKVLDGLYSYRIHFDKWSESKKTRFFTYFKSMYRPDESDLTYLIYPDDWQAFATNNIMAAGLNHKYRYHRGRGNIEFDMRSSSLGSDYNFGQLRLTAVNDNHFKKLKLRTRFHAQLGTGSNPAPESQLYTAGANPEDMMDDKYVRSIGFFPEAWQGFGSDLNHFHYGGGLNLRGYSGYLIPHQVDEEGNLRMVYRGTTGASINAELEFNKLVKFNPRKLRNSLGFTTYLFGDMGVINSHSYREGYKFADLRADAGIGTALTIKKWGPLEMTKPLTIRFDMPFFVNRIPALQDNYWDFRWVVGVSRAF